MSGSEGLESTPVLQALGQLSPGIRALASRGGCVSIVYNVFLRIACALLSRQLKKSEWEFLETEVRLHTLLFVPFFRRLFFSDNIFVALNPLWDV